MGNHVGFTGRPTVNHAVHRLLFPSVYPVFLAEQPFYDAALVRGDSIGYGAVGGFVGADVECRDGEAGLGEPVVDERAGIMGGTLAFIAGKGLVHGSQTICDEPVAAVAFLAFFDAEEETDVDGTAVVVGCFYVHLGVAQPTLIAAIAVGGLFIVEPYRHVFHGWLQLGVALRRWLVVGSFVDQLSPEKSLGGTAVADESALLYLGGRLS